MIREMINTYTFNIHTYILNLILGKSLGVG